MPYSINNGVRTYYEVSGSGPGVILLHAIPFDRRLWLFQVARLSQVFRVINIDLRGFGLSDKPESAFSMDDMVGDVAGVVEAEGGGPVIVLGCSIGSGVGLLLALERPQLVRSLVLVGGNSRGGGRIDRRVAGYLSEDFAGYRRAHMVDLFAPGFAATRHGEWTFGLFGEAADTLSPGSIAQVFRARARCNMTPRLGGIGVPALVVNGEHDNSLESGRETARGIPGARHAVVSGAGHACCLEAPVAFDAALIGFLKATGQWPAATAGDQA